MIETIEEKRRYINYLIVDHLQTYVLGDLDVLDTIQPDPIHGLRGCGIPTAMLIISSIELMGFLLRETALLNDSENNIAYALSYKDYFPQEYQRKETSEILTLVYRHGMMHFFFPKPRRAHTKYSISKTDSADLFIQVNTGNEFVTSLNVNVLSKDFRAFLNRVLDEINTTNDSQLLDNIIKSFGKVDTILYGDGLRTNNIISQTTMSPPVSMVNKK